jgi:transglutaminase-like putative cysteine protease
MDSGACRDSGVLLIALCRSLGIPARFVSGYQENDPDTERQDLHAWCEAWIPGGGWRGFDPT